MLKHKTSEMINVVEKRFCKYIACGKRAYYNNISENKAEYCYIHKTENMINIYSKKCIIENCDKTPSYGIIKNKPTHCIIHKENNMINVYSNICSFENCKKVPTYGIENGKATHCFEHKLSNMIDVIHNICIYDKCTSRAIYGKLINSKLTHCYKHREKGMIQLNKKCIICKEPATFGINLIPKHCETHKEDNEQNLVERKCTKCNLNMILDNNNLCEYCNPATFKKVHLAKQNSLMNYLDSINLKGDSTDKIVNNGECGKERPDRVFDFGDKIIILECDENQHKDRNSECENTRMINIGQSYGGLPVYFIRWNPDNYISKYKSDTINKRYKLVGDYIYNIKENKITLPLALTSVIYMYYDNWEGLINEKWKVIINYNK